MLGLKSDGTIVQWGNTEGLASGMPPGLTDIVVISAGGDGGLAIKSDRTAIWWRRQMDPLPDPRPNILMADAGTEFVVGIQGEGFGLVREFFPSVFVEEGEAIRLAPNVVGGQSYQWFRNSQPIPEATSKSYSVLAATAANAGSYQLAALNGDAIFATPPTEVTVVAAGYPRVLVNGIEARGSIRVSGQAQITLTTTLANPQIFYTLDGSTPTFSSTRYTGPFTLTESTNVTIRALAISGDFSKEAANNPVGVSVLPTFTVNVAVFGPGQVELTPPGGRYFQGDTVRLEAIPNSGARFARWANHLGGTDPVREITITTFHWQIEALFELPPRYSPTIIADGGTVTVSPPDPQPVGADVTISVAPKPGWTFRGWTGDHAGVDPSFVWRVAGPATFKANFATTISTVVSGAGRIDLNPQLPEYLYGSQVTVTPVPTFGNYFVLWGLDATGQPPTAFTLTVTNGPTQVSGLFRPLETPAFQISAARIESAQLKFQVSGSAGKTVVIQSTSDFTIWNDEATITLPASGVVEHTMPSTTAPGQWFFRAQHSP